MSKSNLTTQLAGVTFNTPILNASGTFNPTLFSTLFDFPTTLGGIVTKTVTKEPKIGNPQYRTVELPGIGMLNSIGLQNPGLSYTLDTELPVLVNLGVPVILSLSATSTQDFALMAEAVISHQNSRLISMLELNLSCPNVDKGGVEVGSVPELVKEVVQTVTGIVEQPVFAKLTPNVNSMVPMAAAALEGGASGITAINTLLGLAIDTRKKNAILPRASGGYSGPGVKPVALHHIWQIRKHFPTVQIMGIGGIASATDVLEFMMAGATVVQVGTSCFRDPFVFQTIVTALEAYCEAEGLNTLNEIIGCAHNDSLLLK